jgi:hypothetical protein
MGIACTALVLIMRYHAGQAHAVLGRLQYAVADFERAVELGACSARCLFDASLGGCGLPLACTATQSRVLFSALLCCVAAAGCPVSVGWRRRIELWGLLRSLRSLGIWVGRRRACLRRVAKLWAAMRLGVIRARKDA